MGLDMFLYVKTSNYFSKWWKGSEPKDYEYPEVLKFFETDIGRGSSASVEVTKKFKIAYWRKFNALHGHISSSYYEGDGEYEGTILGNRFNFENKDYYSEIGAFNIFPSPAIAVVENGEVRRFVEK